ncbi:MAG: tetratricopeptide repeat protein [Myxococcota bacterium]
MNDHRRIQRALLLLVLVWAVSPLACVTTTTVSGSAADSSEMTDERKAEARRDLGIDHLSKGRTAMAIRTLLEAERMNSLDPVTHLWLGEAYRRKNLLDKAESQMLQALALKPDSQSTRLNLTGLYIQMEKYEEAIEESRTLALDPTFPTPWRALTNQAWAEFKLRKYDAARASLEMALDFHPTFWPALLNLGILENELGNRLAALEAFEAVAEQDPGSRAMSETRYRMAEVFVAIGHRERAIRHFSDSIDLSPHGPWAEESKRYLKMLR